MPSKKTAAFSPPAHCRLCPRSCGADRRRAAVSSGFCRMGADLYIARAALHFWEEPCISGKNGSGTVFFTGCNLGCVYCQNQGISHFSPPLSPPGKAVSIQRLTEIFLELQEQGAHNINLVTPSHYIPWIACSLSLAKDRGLHLPVVYNSSGYDSPEALAALEGLIQIYLPDFKYWSGQLAARYSGAPDYPAAARAAISEMVRQAGPPSFDSQGIMKRGVMVRLLLLPGCLEDAKTVLSYLYTAYGNRIYYSIMNQYTPPSSSALKAFPELCRPVPPAEYEALLDYAEALGIENAFIQEGGTVSESFIPAFDGSGV